MRQDGEYQQRRGDVYLSLIHILDGYVPLREGEIRLYRAIREGVPLVDAAIYKLVRMTGGVSVKCAEVRAERELQEFLRTVPAGRGQRGINAFLE